MNQSSKNIPMSAAPYVYDEIGAIAWDKMWNNFCILAKEGGPPHRGTKLAFKSDNTTNTTDNYIEATKEITRAYKQLIPYAFQFNKQGNVEIKLTTPNMAKWFADIINSENVSCAQNQNTITLPVNDDFTSAEIKNIVTVTAKVHHYWKNHRTWFAKLVIHLTSKDLEAGIWE